MAYKPRSLREAARTARRAEANRIGDKEELKKGTLLFVPVYGNISPATLDRKCDLDHPRWPGRHL